MMTYEEYKAKVYVIFLRDWLKGVSEEDKLKHLEENEDVIEEGYSGEVYHYNNGNDEQKSKRFTDVSISSSTCSNLDMLY